MAKYRETWEAIDDSTIIGYRDNDTGESIPINTSNYHYQQVLIWLQSNTADPHYTQEQIDAHQLLQRQIDAERYLKATSALVQSYRDALAAGTLPVIPAAKYNKILNQRRRAAKIINKTVQKFSTS
jgi:hypothetical protein